MSKLLALLILFTPGSSMVFAQDLNPHYEPHEQTSSERLQNFKPPAPAPQNNIPTSLPLGNNTTLSPGTGSPQGGYGAHVTHTTQ